MADPTRLRINGDPAHASVDALCRDGLRRAAEQQAARQDAFRLAVRAHDRAVAPIRRVAARFAALARAIAPPMLDTGVRAPRIMKKDKAQ